MKELFTTKTVIASIASIAWAAFAALGEDRSVSTEELMIAIGTIAIFLRHAIAKGK